MTWVMAFNGVWEYPEMVGAPTWVNPCQAHGDAE